MWSEQAAKNFAARCIADNFLANQGLPKPDNCEPYGQNSRPWRSFCKDGTAVGCQEPGIETFRNFPISEMPGLFVQGRKQPRLEQSRSSIGPDGLGCLTPGRDSWLKPRRPRLFQEVFRFVPWWPWPLCSENSNTNSTKGGVPRRKARKMGEKGRLRENPNRRNMNRGSWLFFKDQGPRGIEIKVRVSSTKPLFFRVAFQGLP